jgi:hypothetical protein
MGSFSLPHLRQKELCNQRSNLFIYLLVVVVCSYALLMLLLVLRIEARVSYTPSPSLFFDEVFSVSLRLLWRVWGSSDPPTPASRVLGLQA